MKTSPHWSQLLVNEQLPFSFSLMSIGPYISFRDIS